MFNIFPFDLEQRQGENLFTSFVMANRAKLNEKYGDQVGTSVIPSGYETLFSWYAVEVVILSPTAVKFRTFDSENCPRHTIPATLREAALADYIRQRKLQLAERELDVREAAAAAERRRLAVAAVHAELFGEAS